MRNLSDTWQGRYVYPTGGAWRLPQSETAFVATLLHEGLGLSGASHEFWPAPDGRVLRYAALSGEVQAGAVYFIKAYAEEVAGYRNAPIAYEGRVNAAGSEIAGIWRIKDLPPGRFVMVRGDRQAFRSESRVEAAVR